MRVTATGASTGCEPKCTAVAAASSVMAQTSHLYRTTPCIMSGTYVSVATMVGRVTAPAPEVDVDHRRVSRSGGGPSGDPTHPHLDATRRCTGRVSNVDGELRTDRRVPPQRSGTAGAETDQQHPETHQAGNSDHRSPKNTCPSQVGSHRQQRSHGQVVQRRSAHLGPDHFVHRQVG